ncbi:MAG: pyrroline-5-carboxylate reductase [Verrucomicrobiota bacterium]|nr:pyrroline-5-carboxylate reductase [Verrucomicrobiota bacterium]
MAEIGFIGCGRLARVLIRGLIERKVFAPDQILASNNTFETLLSFSKKTNIHPATNNLQVPLMTKNIVLAVKPVQITSVLAEIKSALTPDHLVISVAAGVPLSKMTPFAGSVVRVMPNTPSQIGCGAAAFATTDLVTEAQKKFVRKIFSAVGIIEPVEEHHLDAITGLSGSGPAYIYLIIEAMVAGAVAQGVPEDLALKLTVQTVKGAALMVEKTARSPQFLREQVTSPGGTTAEGLRVLESNQVPKAFSDAIHAATMRSITLGSS